MIDGSDESRFQEVKEVIDELYSRRMLDEAGLPIIEKILKKQQEFKDKKNYSIENIDLE